MVSISAIALPRLHFGHLKIISISSNGLLAPPYLAKAPIFILFFAYLSIKESRWGNTVSLENIQASSPVTVEEFLKQEARKLPEGQHRAARKQMHAVKQAGRGRAGGSRSRFPRRCGLAVSPQRAPAGAVSCCCATGPGPAERREAAKATLSAHGGTSLMARPGDTALTLSGAFQD